MVRNDALFLVLAAGDDHATAERLRRELHLARILLGSGAISMADLEEAVRLRRASGLLLEHCLVQAGAVDFDTMVEAMGRRRTLERRQGRCHRGDAGHSVSNSPLAG